MLDAVGPAPLGSKWCERGPAPDGPRLSVWGPQKENANLRSRIWALASRCNLKRHSRLQQGNKTIVFNLKVSF